MTGDAIRISGSPTPEEVAAVVAVLAAASGDGGSDDRAGARRGSPWSSRRQLLRGTHDPGPGSWRSALRP